MSFSLEKPSITGFSGFCKNNIPLVIAVSIMLFFAYGIRLFWHSIGIDTELFMADKENYFLWQIQTGRFGLALLSNFLHIKQFNPFTAQFTALCLLWFCTVSWCYIIAIFSKNTGLNNKLIPFALVFMTMPVWAEMYCFIFMAAECTLIISMCPLCYISFL